MILSCRNFQSFPDLRIIIFVGLCADGVSEKKKEKSSVTCLWQNQHKLRIVGHSFGVGVYSTSRALCMLSVFA